MTERRFLGLVEFLASFIDELNGLAEEGAAVLVEGPRDREALTRLGYAGPALIKSSLKPTHLQLSVRGFKCIIILTDLDSEGRRLAGRYAEALTRSGIGVSLAQRRRLAQASHGLFLHVENLSRFASEVGELSKMLKNEHLNTG